MIPIVHNCNHRLLFYLLRYNLIGNIKIRHSMNNGVQNTSNSSTAIDSLPNAPPEEPTTCCMSGCANCVWLEYAEKLSAYLCDSGGKAMQIIEDKVSDPNVKAFLMHELRMRQKDK